MRPECPSHSPRNVFANSLRHSMQPVRERENYASRRNSYSRNAGVTGSISEANPGNGARRSATANGSDLPATAMIFGKLFRKPKAITCAACGKPIEPREPRMVDKNRVTKAERHTHLTCPKPQHPQI